MTRQELVSWATSRGFIQDSFGNLKKTTEEGVQLRFKLNPRKVRYERKVSFDKSKYGYKPPDEWIRISSAAYKDLSINPETGKIRGLSRSY